MIHFPLTGQLPGDTAETLQQLLKLQNDFASRLYADTLSYLRGLPAPGTVILVEGETVLEEEGQPGGSVRLAVEVHNHQAVYAIVAPALSSLASENGVTWYPDTTWIPPYQLLEPNARNVVTVEVSLPTGIPSATYRGAIVFLGNPEGVGVAIRVSEATVPTEAAEATVPAKATVPTEAAEAVEQEGTAST